MDKNEKEKNLLYEWAVTSKESYSFPMIEKEKESYYIKRDTSVYIRAYGFETLPELKMELEELWKGREIGQALIPILVSAMKNKPTENRSLNEKKEIKESSKEKMPSYI